jgi:hypothetical protein
MRRGGKLSRLERLLAIGLSLVWLGAGCAALHLAFAQARWGVGIGALLALLYGAAWLRVAALSRLLTWPELIAPWRALR